MRTVLVVLVVVASGCLWLDKALAENEVEKAVANEIANNLKQSDQLRGYKIGIKIKGDTAWLVGQVSSAEQRTMAMEIARKSIGANRVVDRLTIVEPKESNPLRGPSLGEAQPAKQQPEAPGTVAAGNGRQPAATGRQSNHPTPARRGNQPVAYQRELPATRTPAGRPIAMHPSAGGPRMAGNNRLAGYACSDCGNGAMGYNGAMSGPGGPMPAYGPGGGAMGRARYDQAVMPGYAWPSYAAYPNYAALTYPQQYSPTAWPYIGPFYPYPQVPLGWRKVTLQWDDGWWFLDFKDRHCHH